MQNWHVKCEGYSYEGDAYVLKGSCWLDFELVFAQSGDEEQTDDVNDVAVGGAKGRTGAMAWLWGGLRTVAVVALVVALLVWWWSRNDGERTRRGVSEAERLLANVHTNDQPLGRAPAI